MSKQVGARTHASAVRAQHTSRVAAVGLAVFLTFGYGAAAQAGEGSDVSGVSTADAGFGTADAGGDARPGERAATRSDDAPGRPDKADGTIEISATSSDTDLVTLVVVTADGRRTTTVTPVSDAADADAVGPGQLRRTDAAVAVAAAAKEDKPGKDNKVVSTEPGHKGVATEPADATEPQTGNPESGKPEDAGHQEVVVCHNGRTIVIDSNGLNGHGEDELCAQEPVDNSADGGGQNSSGGDGSDAGGAGGEGATSGDASADDASVGTDGIGSGNGTDTGSDGGDGAGIGSEGDDGADAGSEGGDGADAGSDGGDGAVNGEQGSTGDETAPGHSEQEDGSSEGSTPKGESGTEVVVALPGEDGTIEGGPVAGQPGAGQPGGEPGAGEPGTGTPADQVKGDEADGSGTEQPVGERAAGSRPVASPTGVTKAAGTAIAPDSARLPGQRTGDEILGAAEGSARNRPAALVLPQTGAAESLGIQTGAGLLMVLAGVMTLRGRRRSTG